VEFDVRCGYRPNAQRVFFVEDKALLNIEMEAKSQMLEERNRLEELSDIRNGGEIESRRR